jgi:hypothetical protein
VNIVRNRKLSWLVVAVAVALGITSTLPTVAMAAPQAESEGPAAGGQLKTIAVVASTRFEKLISDISFLGSLAGKPEVGQMIEGGLALFTQGKGVNALDKTQPWGVIVQSDGAKFLPVACLPVPKVDDLFDIAKAYGAEVKDADDGAREVVLPNQRSIFVKPNNGLCFISLSASALARLPENAQALLGKAVGEYDLGGAISVKNIPEQHRQFAIQAMQAGLQQGMKQRPGQSDEEYAEQQKIAEAQLEQVARFINELDAVKFGWAIDAQQHRTYMDFTYQFQPGSKMAQQIAAYGQPQTSFAGFYQPDAAATVTFVTKADPKLIAEDLAQFESAMRTMREQLNRTIDEKAKINDEEARAALKAAASDWFDAFEATIKAGQMDGGATLQLGPESLTFVAGAHVEEPAKLESGLKKLEAAAKKSPQFPGIKWNAANHAGVTFHTMAIPVPDHERAPRQLLGEEANVAIGLGPKAVYLAVGRDNLNAINKAIDASAADAGKAVPPFELALSLAPILETAAAQAENNDKKEIIQAVADMLKNQAQGRDHIRAVGQVIPNGLKYRFEAEEGVLRALGTAAAEAQRQKLQAHQ